MQRFSALFEQLDQSTATRDKVQALVDYFATAPALDAAWTVHLLRGAKLKRQLNTTQLRLLIAQASSLPDWLVDETYAHVGDLAETAALLVDEPAVPGPVALAPLALWTEQLLPGLRALDPPAQHAQVRCWWTQLSRGPRFLLNKLLTGAFRVGVSHGLVAQALAQHAGVDTATIAHRLSGEWLPSDSAWARLLAPADGSVPADDRPYPFFLASALEGAVTALGERSEWQAEWKWDGIRAQLIRRGTMVGLWSRGEERLDGRFPEIEQSAQGLPDVVLDGEILGWRDTAPLSFAELQKRIAKRTPGPRLLRDCPVQFLAYDLLELDGTDWRPRPLVERRAKLEALAQAHPLHLMLSPTLDAVDWDGLTGVRAEARARGVEGLMLKRLDSPYQVGRRRGDWWKWKLAPLTADAVLVYAQAGHGRWATLYTDYTFAIWDGNGRLVPFAKAYSGLDDREILALDKWIRAHTLDRHGPVRVVEPVQVFELAFEGIQDSPRHKSGIATRFPRILRWRHDKPATEADTVAQVRALARAS